jgi:hypothetical protein
MSTVAQPTKQLEHQATRHAILLFSYSLFSGGRHTPHARRPTVWPLLTCRKDPTMNQRKYRTNDLNRSSNPNKIARTRPVSPITLGLYLHATRPTPSTHEPACRAALDPLSETVENASVCRSPYDSTFHPFRFPTSSRMPVQATEHAFSPLKSPISRKYSSMTRNTHNQFLWVNPSPFALSQSFSVSLSLPSSLPYIPVPSSSHCSPLPGLLLLESPLSRTPAFADKSSCPTASRRVRSTLTPKVNLSEQGRLGVSGLHYAGAALVDHVVLKGVKVETQADNTMLTQALAFVAPQTTERVTRGLQNTFPLLYLARMKGGAL